jgi:hypothetical protein
MHFISHDPAAELIVEGSTIRDVSRFSRSAIPAPVIRALSAAAPEPQAA